MLGAIIGDIVGSRFTKKPVSSMDFELLSKDSHFTDNTVLTLGVAKGLLEALRQSEEDPDIELIEEKVAKNMKELVEKYPYVGYSLLFQKWLKKAYHTRQPYETQSNTAAKRVSPVAYFAEEEFSVTELAEVVSGITHESEEALEGADILAHLIYLARKGFTKADMYDYVTEVYPPMSENIISYRQGNHFSYLTKKTVPLAIYAFMISESFKDTLKIAVYLKGDTAGIASMAGAIAAAYYGIPKDLKEQIWRYLPQEFIDIIKDWNTEFDNREVVCPLHVLTKYHMLFNDVLNPLGSHYNVNEITTNLAPLIRSYTNELIEFINVKGLLSKYRNWTLTENREEITEVEAVVFQLYQDIRVNRFNRGYLKEKIVSGDLFEQLRKLKCLTEKKEKMTGFSYEFGIYEETSKYVFQMNLENMTATVAYFEGNQKLDETTINQEDTAMIMEALQSLEMDIWLPNYYNLEHLNGVQWQIKVFYTHQQPTIYAGSDGFPKNWDQFINVLRQIQHHLPNFFPKVTYYQVEIPGFDKLYDYRFDDEIQINDQVCVPFGHHDTLKIGKVVAKKDYYLDDVPYPLEKMKYIAGILK